LKSVFLIAIVAITLLIPTDAFSISVSEIEKKLRQAQSEDEIENILMDFTTSPEYMEACSELFEKIKSYQGMIDDPTISDKKKKEIVTTVQNYQSLRCNFTQNLWGDAPNQNYSLSQCNDLIPKFDEQNKNYHERYGEALQILEKNQMNMKNPMSVIHEDYFDSKKIMEDLSNEFHENCIPQTKKCEILQNEMDLVYSNYKKLRMGSMEEQMAALDVGILNNKQDFLCNFQNSITQYHESQEKYFDKDIPTINYNSEIQCGDGTIENAYGQCVAEQKAKQSKGGGCLIATATYGSEMSYEVQQLRELRDNQLLNTESGTAFMGAFNDIYYSFSPIVADYERENPYFKEAVKLAITPLISSLSILNHVDMDSESEVLGYGISLILLNLGMYLGVPAVVVIGIKKRSSQ